jgi:hypothetical protein
MGIVAGIGAAAAAASLGSSISSLTSGGGPGSTQGGNPATYIPQAQGQADQLYQNIFNTGAPYATENIAPLTQGYTNIANNILNNPFANYQLYGTMGGGGGLTQTSVPTAMHAGATGGGGGLTQTAVPTATYSGSAGGAAATPQSYMAALQNAYPNGYPIPGGGTIPISGLAGTELPGILAQMSPQQLQQQLNMIPGYGTATGGGGGGLTQTPVPAATYSGVNTSGSAGQGAGGGTGSGGVIGAANYGMNTLAPMEAASAGSLYGAGNSILNTAFDPQHALYNQLQNQTAQQAAAANAASGVYGSYAAGTTDQSLQNLNIAWQNQQLGREAQGIQAGGQAYSGAADLGGMALNTQVTAAGLPYNTYLGQQQNSLAALDAASKGYASALTPAQDVSNWLQSYLNLGQSASGQALVGQNLGFNQSQTLGTNAAGALASLENNQGLANLFGGGGSSNYSNPAATYGDITGLGTSSGGY